MESNKDKHGLIVEEEVGYAEVESRDLNKRTEKVEYKTQEGVVAEGLLLLQVCSLTVKVSSQFALNMLNSQQFLQLMQRRYTILVVGATQMQQRHWLDRAMPYSHDPISVVKSYGT